MGDFGAVPRWRTLAREPFVHFLILGAVLFAGHAIWQHFQDRTASTIIVDPQEMERRAILFAGENKRSPTEEELKALLYDFVQEEALVREAERLGLGEGDTIVRRRLAQKARFILEDTVTLAEPDEEALCAHMATNPQAFAKPPMRSFSHIFISPEGSSDDQLRSRGAELLAASRKGNWRALGDPFMLNREYRMASYPDVANSFGPDFAKSLFAIAASDKGFQGPMESAFGLHLVRVDAAKDAVMPECRKILAEIEKHWRETQREAANAAKIRALIDQYDVIVAE